jgi:hypothetical protein
MEVAVWGWNQMNQQEYKEMTNHGGRKVHLLVGQISFKV